VRRGDPPHLATIRECVKDWLAVVDAETLLPSPARARGWWRWTIAARVGRARLIDNFEWRAT
jgi:pantothenate synthetase